MECFEVHSKDFLIKWLNVPSNSIVRWKAKPLKKSIHLMIYKNISQDPSSPHYTSASASSNDKKLSLDEKLSKSNLSLVLDIGKLVANELHQDEFRVNSQNGGVYAFVFDNTSSKSTSKKIMFNQFIDPVYPNDNPDQVSKDSYCSSLTPDPKIDMRFDLHDERTAFNNAYLELTNPAENVSNNKSKLDSNLLTIPQSPLEPPVSEQTASREISVSNRARSTSVYTLSNLLNTSSAVSNEDYDILKKLQTFEHGSHNNNNIVNNASNGSSYPPSAGPSSSNVSNFGEQNNLTSPGMLVTPTSAHFPNIKLKSSSHSIKLYLDTSKKKYSVSNQSSSNYKGFSAENDTFRLLKSNVVTSKNGQYIEGILLKRKRKKNYKAYSKRFFTLNFKHGLLEYKLNDQTSTTRGSMHIKLVEVTANRKTKEITIDSGVEIWHLKALNDVDWEIWVSALDIIRLRANYNPQQFSENHSFPNVSIAPLPQISSTPCMSNEVSGALDANYGVNSKADDSLIATPLSEDIIIDLQQKLIILNSRLEIATNRSEHVVNCLKDPLLSKNDVDPFSTFTPPSIAQEPPQQQNNQQEISGYSSAGSSPNHSIRIQSNHSQESLSSSDQNGKIKRKISLFKKRGSLSTHNEHSAVSLSSMVAENEALNKVSKAVKESEILFNELSEITASLRSSIELCKSLSKVSTTNIVSHPTEKEMPLLARRNSGLSIQESIFTSDNFFDAREYIETIKTTSGDPAGVIIVDSDPFDDIKEDNSEALRLNNEKKYQNVVGAISPQRDNEKRISSLTLKDIFDEDYYPLKELENTEIDRRSDIRETKSVPPSLLQFLRKNVGKDLASIAMPVTSNEPLSMLQKYAEIFEYTDLISKSMSAKNSNIKMIYISAFAISYLSSFRSKERNIRKPFLSLLGETYELVREDLKYRLIMEKVSHRPSILCCNVDNPDWEVTGTLMPINKFWGKSMELVNKGSLNLTIKSTGEMFEWNQATTMLKNLIAGEKYIEPIDSITVNSSNGEKAVIEFKPSGMFSGRSEELVIRVYDSNDNLCDILAKGNWTDSLYLILSKDINSKKIPESAELIWKCNPLINKSDKKWGFTKFAVELNDITSIEKDHLPPTDSRLRPDMKFYEDGDEEKAETLKLELEQLQRNRRKDLEQENVKYLPTFFLKEGDLLKDEELLLNWKFIKGVKGYWSRRKVNDWDDLLQLYDNSV